MLKICIQICNEQGTLVMCRLVRYSRHHKLGQLCSPLQKHINVCERLCNILHLFFTLVPNRAHYDRIRALFR